MNSTVIIIFANMRGISCKDAAALCHGGTDRIISFECWVCMHSSEKKSETERNGEVCERGKMISKLRWNSLKWEGRLEPRRPKLDAMCRQLLTKFCVLGWARYGASVNGVLVIMHHTEDVVGDAIRICDTMPCADSHCAIAERTEYTRGMYFGCRQNGYT